MGEGRQGRTAREPRPVLKAPHRRKSVSRLRRLEGAIPTGCPGCADRRGLYVMVDASPEGQARNGPRPCERCDEVPEEIIEIKEVIVRPGDVLASSEGCR